MVVARFITAAVLATSMLAPAGASAAEGGSCSLGSRYDVSSVKPYSSDENAGYTTYRKFRGAEIYVPAEPGLTQEWLRRTLDTEIASGACDFGARNVEVDVLSSGGGFSVRLSG